MTAPTESKASGVSVEEMRWLFDHAQFQEPDDPIRHAEVVRSIYSLILRQPEVMKLVEAAVRLKNGKWAFSADPPDEWAELLIALSAYQAKAGGKP